jgi:hypothetical protein
MAKKKQRRAPSSDPPTDPLLLKIGGAAEVLTMSERSLWNKTQPRGPIPCVRIGPKTIRYLLAALRAYIGQAGSAT